MRAALACVVAVILAGCSAGGASTSPSPVGSSVASSWPVGSSVASPSPSAAPTASPAASPSLIGSGVTIYDETSDAPNASAQVELVTPAGRHVYIDVINPSALARKPTSDDILLVTHFDPDHADMAVDDYFPGQKLVAKAGSIALPDVAITGVMAAHGGEDGPATTPDGSEYLFVIDIGGVRIVHFGDLGQTQLTSDQTAVIGKPDVAFSQLNNPYSDMGEGSRLGFDQMNQVGPRIFVPTHLWGSLPTATAATEEWPAMYSPNPSIHLVPGDLPATTTVLFMGLNAREFATDLELPLAPW
jgi:L-ascorbate metabolism protein UlaG (beta-lactamase superfamily)